MKDLRGDYMVFTDEHDEAQARAAFVKRHGYEPQQILRVTGRLWVGPILKGEQPAPAGAQLTFLTRR